MSTRLISSESVLGIDTQLQNIQDDFNSIVIDDAFFHNFLSESGSITVSALTRLTIENIQTKQTLNNLLNQTASLANQLNILAIPHPPIDANSLRPIFKVAGINKYFDTIVDAQVSAMNDQFIWANTANNSFTINLPSNPMIGSIVTIADYNSSFTTNNVIISTNNLQKINNDLANYILDKPNAYTFIYVGEQFGWTTSNNNAETNLAYINDYYFIKNEDRVLVDTRRGNFSLFLDQNPNQYDTFTIIDIASNFDINPVLVDGNGRQFFNGRFVELNIRDLSISFIYNNFKWYYIETLPDDKNNLDIKNVTNNFYDVSSNPDYLLNEILFVSNTLTPTIINLPTNPNIGDKLTIVDDCDFSLHNLTINNVNSSNLLIDIKYTSITLIYTNPVKGWLIKG